jgi:hypothetical protein
MGALVDVDGGEAIWIADFDAWKDDVRGTRVEVTGRVIERHDLPVFVQREGDLPKAGMPVPPGTDLEAASRRFLLSDVKWRPAPGH